MAPQFLQQERNIYCPKAYSHVEAATLTGSWEEAAGPCDGYREDQEE